MSKTDQALRRLVTYVKMPEFPACNVPVQFVAAAMQKDAGFVRAGIDQRWLPIGFSQKAGKRTNYYISPKLLWEVTGIVYQPEKEECRG